MTTAEWAIAGLAFVLAIGMIVALGYIVIVLKRLAGRLRLEDDGEYEDWCWFEGPDNPYCDCDKCEDLRVNGNCPCIRCQGSRERAAKGQYLNFPDEQDEDDGESWKKK